MSAPPDYFERYLDTRAELAATRAAIGNAIHALNLAAKDAERRGESPELFRKTVADLNPVRWAQ